MVIEPAVIGVPFFTGLALGWNSSIGRVSDFLDRVVLKIIANIEAVWFHASSALPSAIHTNCRIEKGLGSIPMTPAIL